MINSFYSVACLTKVSYADCDWSALSISVQDVTSQSHIAGFLEGEL